jgi:hypothetical protein
MAAESIRVYFQPLLSVGGKTFHHETLIYTNADGQQFYATAYAPKAPPGEDPGTISGKATIGRDFGAASSAVSTDGASPYGTVITQWGRLDNLPNRERDHLMGSPGRSYDSQVLKVGDDLSPNWSKIEQAYFQVGEQGLPYSPPTQNSNSAASTGLTAGDVPLPAGTGLSGDHWAPASGVILPTSMTHPTLEPAFQSDAVYSPAGDFYGNFPRVSAAAAMQSPMAFNPPGSGPGPRMPDDFGALALGVARLLNGTGQYKGDSLITPAEGSSLSQPMYARSTVDTDESSLPMRRLVGRIVDTRELAMQSPSNEFLSPDRGDSFGDRFGNWTSSGAGMSPRNPNQPLSMPGADDGGVLKHSGAGPAQLPAGGFGDNVASLTPEPQQSQGSAPPYTGEYLPYVRQPNGNKSPAFAFDPTSPPPLFTRPNYLAPLPDDSIQRWIASLAGVAAG